MAGMGSRVSRGEGSRYVVVETPLGCEPRGNMLMVLTIMIWKRPIASVSAMHDRIVGQVVLSFLRRINGVNHFSDYCLR